MRDSIRSLFATDFGIWPLTGNVHGPADEIFRSQTLKARLANYLVSYDQVVIPTGNFLIMPVLRLWLGESAFDSLVSNREIVFARYDQWIAYVGNGGLVAYQISPNPERPKEPNLATSYYSTMDEAIDTAVRITNPVSTAERKVTLVKLLAENVIPLPTASLVDKLKEESFADILNSRYLMDFLAIRNQGKSLLNLHGSSPKSVTIFNPHVLKSTDVPEIRSVLRVGYENYLLRMAGHLKTTNMTGDSSTLSVLKAKGQRLGYATDGEQAFTQMLSISDVPDIGKAFASGELTPEVLLDLRRSREADRFRRWLQSGSWNETADEAVGRFVESVTRRSTLDRLPVKLLRFAAVAAWGALEPLSGTAIGAADAFLLPKFFGSAPPSLFMVRAKDALVASSSGVPPPSKPRKRR